MKQQEFDFPSYRKARQQDAINAAPKHRNRKPPQTFEDMYYDVMTVHGFLRNIAKGAFGTTVHEGMSDILKEVGDRLMELGGVDEFDETEEDEEE